MGIFVSISFPFATDWQLIILHSACKDGKWGTDHQTGHYDEQQNVLGKSEFPADGNYRIISNVSPYHNVKFTIFKVSFKMQCLCLLMLYSPVHYNLKYFLYSEVISDVSALATLSGLR